MNFLILAALIQVASASTFAAKTFLQKAARAASVATIATAYKGIQRSECVPERPRMFEDWRGVAKCSPQMTNYAFNNYLVTYQANYLIALALGKAEKMKKYLDEGVDPNVPDCDNYDFFDYAFKNKLPADVIQLAIKKGLKVNELDRQSGLTPLDRAIDQKRFEIADILVQNGALSTRSVEELIIQIVENCSDRETELSPFFLIMSLFQANNRRMSLLVEPISIARSQEKRELLAFLSALARDSI